MVDSSPDQPTASYDCKYKGRLFPTGIRSHTVSIVVVKPIYRMHGMIIACKMMLKWAGLVQLPF
jgi:hypothetical protein